ncbi:MAG: Hpt domain-containing protein [Oscillospiraceae bacterium]|nr:Hpt domain-containing protein [Oscillospiraceae bacterium]
MRNVMMRLASWGCDTKAALERMADDRDFYLTLLGELLADPLFSQLRRALDCGDVKEAFETAHTLKGVLGNLSLTPMYAQICEIVELLRSGTTQGVEPHYEELMRLFEQLRSILNSDKESSAEK